MDCRAQCGACCIAPSISAAIPGMPNGKPAGVACVHLDHEFRCLIFDDPMRPSICHQFQAEKSICGDNRSQALITITELETITSRA